MALEKLFANDVIQNGKYYSSTYSLVTECMNQITDYSQVFLHHVAEMLKQNKCTILGFLSVLCYKTPTFLLDNIDKLPTRETSASAHLVHINFLSV